MDFLLSETDEMVRDAARRFADDYLTQFAAKMDREEKWYGEVFKQAAELGLAGVTIPEAHGGMGLGNLQLSLVLEEVNRVCASTGVTLSVHNSLVAGPLMKFGTDEQKQRYLPKLASGQMLGAYSLSEPGSGSDAAGLTCKADKQGDNYIISGVKAWVTSGEVADFLILLARTAEHKTRGISAFLIETAWPGFRVSKAEKKMGLRGSKTNEITFDNLECPAANMLGEEGIGFKIALDTLDGGRIGIASQSLGIARAALEASLKYCHQRTAFGKELGEFQAIQWKLADMSARLDAARLMTHRAAWLRDAGKPCNLEASQAKLLASTLANDAAQEAVQIHGGAGYCMDFPVERYMRDARITEIYEGTTEIQKLVIARNLLRT